MNMTGRRSGVILSGGVAVLFSEGFTTVSFKVEEIMCDHILNVKVQYEHVKMIFVNVYAPVLNTDRWPD